MTSSALHPDRLFSSDSRQREIARELYGTVRTLPIISPHGHTDPNWFADNKPFPNASELLIKPDHYLLRMLYSKGVSLASLGLQPACGGPCEENPEQVWQTFADHYYLFRGTPTRLWMDHVLGEVFGIERQLDSQTGADIYAEINRQLATPAFLPRALLDRFNIEVIATTESPLDSLQAHGKLRDALGAGRVITAYRPDPVVDPDYEGFSRNIEQFEAISGEDCGSYAGYLRAHRERRLYFREMGATSTDHGHPSARCEDLTPAQCEKLYQGALRGELNAEQADQFRGQLLTEMALMSLDDGLVMQLHPGVYRNHNPALFADFGRDRGADVPLAGEFVRNLKPLLDRVGNHRDFTLILFTLDETTYARELAPLAGHYPALLLGPPWWFHDSPEGMLRYRQQVTETAGFYNTAGFNDDTRAFLSIPARHDVARRMDCRFLAQLVAEHRLEMNEAAELAQDLTCNLARRAYRL
ncbi:glucuronate isomerase [Pseudohalioglobus lutimaris]|uniref:Uronate isomerase n=1 Tax=Pseudohalioglobus lutimaris TaxID=1737061 RepID=A0A2N5X277_9GAMM|nr:glucuronate isomerase [Pseudohalioglobus lutimaris]PLW68589.1 glucuronate isomerase [Pseudohalioglobus lutimaris]